MITTGTSIAENPRALSVTSMETWLRTKAKSSTATLSMARSLSACAPTGRTNTGALSFCSSAEACGVIPSISSALSAPSLATRRPASGRPPVPAAAAFPSAPRMSVEGPCAS